MGILSLDKSPEQEVLLMGTKEKIAQAQKRIKELETLIKYWTKG